MQNAYVCQVFLRYLNPLQIIVNQTRTHLPSRSSPLTLMTYVGKKKALVTFANAIFLSFYYSRELYFLLFRRVKMSTFFPSFCTVFMIYRLLSACLQYNIMYIIPQGLLCQSPIKLSPRPF